MVEISSACKLESVFTPQLCLLGDSFSAIYSNLLVGLPVPIVAVLHFLPQAAELHAAPGQFFPASRDAQQERMLPK